MIGLRILGGALLTREDSPLSGKPAQPRRIALLALLAGHPHHTLARDKLLAFLWPESDEEQGRHRLSESLYVLRKALGEDTLISEGDHVRLEVGRVVCDLVTFRAAIQEEELETAVDLYTGPLLDGFFLKGAHEFHRWLEVERLALADVLAESVETLALAADGMGDPLRALPWWNRLTVHDPYNSRYALGRMRALARCGDPGNAVQHALDHRRVLREELGAEATPDVLELAEALRAGRFAEEAALGGDPAPSPREGLQVRSEPSEGAADPFLPPPGAAAHRKTPRGRRWAAAGVAFIALLGVGAMAYSLTGGGGPTRIPNLVVVPPFENRTGDPELNELGVLAAFWVEEALQQVEGVQLFPSYLLPQPPLLGDNGSPGRAPEAGIHSDQTPWHDVNASWAVRGTIRSLGDSLEVRVDVIDLTLPRREQQVVELGVRDSMPGILDRVARRVGGAMAFEVDPYMGEIEGRYQPLTHPPTIEALREHRLGYLAYDRSDRAASLRHHLAAYALDTTLIRAVVAAAYMSDDYRVKDSLARFATQRRNLLSRRGQLDLGVLNALLTRDHEAALGVVRAAVRMEEGGFSSVMEAYFAMRVNLPGEALRATERYDPLPEWRRTEAFQYWVFRARALHMLGRHQDALTEARAGRERYPTHQALLREEVRALAALGGDAEVSGLLLEARFLPGVRASEAVLAGQELRAHGHSEAAKRVFRDAAEWLEESLVEGQRNGRRRLELARALYGAERWAEAYEVAQALLSEEPGDVALLGLAGCAAARLGDSARAEAFTAELANVMDPEGPGEPYYQMATIAATLGRANEAMRLLYQAHSEGVPHGLRLHQDMNLEPLRQREDFIALVTPKG